MVWHPFWLPVSLIILPQRCWNIFPGVDSAIYYHCAHYPQQEKGDNNSNYINYHAYLWLIIILCNYHAYLWLIIILCNCHAYLWLDCVGGDVIEIAEDATTPETKWWIKDLQLFLSDRNALLTGKDLTEALMNAVQTLLHHQFPRVKGLQDTGLSHYLSFTTTKRNAVQIFHIDLRKLGHFNFIFCFSCWPFLRIGSVGREII